MHRISPFIQPESQDRSLHRYVESQTLGIIHFICVMVHLTNFCVILVHCKWTRQILISLKSVNPNLRYAMAQNITHSSACHACATAQPHEYKSTTQISSRDSFFIMIRSPSNWSTPSTWAPSQHPKRPPPPPPPPPQDPAKSRSHETGILNCRITQKPDRHISSTAAEVPVKSQSDRTIPNTNPAAPRPYEIPRKDVPSDIETGPCILERSNGITAQIYIHPVIHVHHGWKMRTFLQSADPNPRKEALPDIQRHSYDT